MGPPRSREELEESQDRNEPPTKIRRTTRACIQCRMRKQRCDGPSPTDPLLPCRRCCQLGATCSFTNTPLEAPSENGTIASTVHRVSKLQKQVYDHQKRIQSLEQALNELRSSGTENIRRESRITIESEAVSGSNAGEESPSDTNALTSVLVQPNSTRKLSTRDSSYISPHDLGAERGVAPRMSAPSTSPRTEPNFTMDALNLDTPMSTLRNLASLSKESISEESYVASRMTYDPIFPVLTRKECQRFEQDPVAQGILSLEEAQQAFDIFFTHCHPHAPFLCSQTQRSAELVRQTSPTLFLSVCVVGARFWQTANGQINTQGLHESYYELVTLLDTNMSKLLLSPGLSDVNLDHIRSLLLYIQWMPVEQYSPGVCQTRYNDISAWSVLGLAIRYAIFLGLDRLAIEPFLPTCPKPPNQNDFARLRVWINLLTCDCHLMLSAGLPATLDPEPFTKIGRAFAGHRDSLQPADSQTAAICELALIVKRAAKASGDPSVRNIDSATLKKVNAEFDSWELFWTSAASDSFPHSQIPFTSYRWYRLALNSACLTTILSPPPKSQLHQPKKQIQLTHLLALENSLLASSQTLLALSAQTSPVAWQSQSSSLSAFPKVPLTISPMAISRFRFAVDSAWITHTFAAVFLVLCYTRGAIDDELNILHLRHPGETVTAPARPRVESLFFRLIKLASEIFDGVCKTSAVNESEDESVATHPAVDYRGIINHVFALVLEGSKDDTKHEERVIEGTSEECLRDDLGTATAQGLGIDMSMDMDGLFGLMYDAGFNWQGGLFRNDGSYLDSM